MYIEWQHKRRRLGKVYIITKSDLLRTILYQGSVDRCKGYRNPDLNRLDLAISGNPLL